MPRMYLPRFPCIRTRLSFSTSIPKTDRRVHSSRSRNRHIPRSVCTWSGCEISTWSSEEMMVGENTKFGVDIEALKRAGSPGDHQVDQLAALRAELDTLNES